MHLQCKWTLVRRYEDLVHLAYQRYIHFADTHSGRHGFRVSWFMQQVQVIKLLPD